MTQHRTLHVEHCMGTVFTIDIRDHGDWAIAVAEVVAWLYQVDAVFSTYKSESDISRLRAGTLRLTDAHPDVAAVLDLCAAAQTTTEGWFTALIDRQIDPTGLVKGWAIERASTILRTHGARNHAVNGGGDVQLSGEAGAGQPWRVGIADPADRRAIVSVVSGSDIGVATSGTAERGAHIVDPFTGRPATALASATVVGPSVMWADVYATAAFAMGGRAISWIDRIADYSALVVDTDGTVRSSSDWPSSASNGHCPPFDA